MPEDVTVQETPAFKPMATFGDQLATAGCPFRDVVYGIALQGPTGTGQIAVLTVFRHGECQLPGGGIDPGETVEAALIRELREETGMAGAVGQRLAEAIDYRVDEPVGGGTIKRCRYHLLAIEGVLGPPEEAGHAPRWLTVHDAVRRLTHAVDRWALQDRMRRPA